MVDTSAIAILPARGGSKRIPRKNIKLFGGKPIIAHALEVAKQSNLFERIIVSTEDDEIARVSARYGGEVPFMRPRELADGLTSTDDVLVDTLERLNDMECHPEFLCCIYPTAALLSPKRIVEGFQLIQKSRADSVIPVLPYNACVQWALKMDDDGRLEMIWPEFRLTRTQDLPQAYLDAGQFYWVRTKNYLIERRLYATHSTGLVLNRGEVQDIDTVEDWIRAEKLLSARGG